MKHLFNFINWNKPGKGVDPNEKKNKIFLFFILFYQKIFKIIIFNIIGLIILFPLIAYAITQISTLLLNFDPNFDLSNIFRIFLLFSTSISKPIFIIFVILSTLSLGPLSSGMIYVFRNISRREHIWGLRDLFLNGVKNIKQSIIIGILDFIIMYSLFVCSRLVLYGVGAPIILVLIIVILLWSIMKPYIYMQIVTFKIGIFSVIRNSILFVFIGIKNNIIMLISYGFIIVLSLLVPIPFLLLISISMIYFVSAYCIYWVVEEKMLSVIN